MKIEIFGAPSCSYCDSAKELAHTLTTGAVSVEYSYFDLMEEANMEEAKKRLGSAPRSIPQIFIDGDHVGGFTEFRNMVSAAAMKAGGTL